MLSFNELPYKKRLSIAENTAHDILTSLKSEGVPYATTGWMMEQIIERAGLELEKGHKQSFANMLLALAAVHPAASQDGEQFNRFGKLFRRWRWKPYDGELIRVPAKEPTFLASYVRQWLIEKGELGLADEWSEEIFRGED